MPIGFCCPRSANRTAQMEAMWRRHRTEEGGGQRREDGMTADMGTREKSPQEARERGEGDKEGAPLNALEAGLDDTSMEGFLHKRYGSRGREGILTIYPYTCLGSLLGLAGRRGGEALWAPVWMLLGRTQSLTCS